MDFLNSLSPEVFLVIGVLFFSIVVHEIAHGYAALHLGDDTAKRAGRLTLNPVVHIDMWGTIIIPLSLFVLSSPFLFGYAKPVPYNPQNLSDKKWGDAKVAFAGPLSNFILASLFMLGIGVLSVLGQDDSTISLLQTAVFMNIFLAVLNLIPVPPLDGSKILLDVLKNYSLGVYIRVRDLFRAYQWVLLVLLIVMIFNFNFLFEITNAIYQGYYAFLFWV